MGTMAVWVGLVAALGPGALAAAAGGKGMDDVRTITVTGESAIHVVPDEVRITLGVETLDRDLGTAKKENDARMKRVLASAKANGVEDKRIATDQIEVEPRYEYEKGRREFLGYSVRRTVALTLRKMEAFDAVLSGALEAGANHVHDVRFGTTELRKHRDQARSLAIRAALEKAQALAKEVGQKVGKPRTINESGGSWPSYGRGWGSGRGSSQMSQNVVQMAEGGGGDVEGTTAPGTIGVTAEVHVVFELE